MSEQFPITAPEGRHFYLANGTGLKKKYFRASHNFGGKNGRVKLTITHDRTHAMKFTSRELAVSFLKFVNNGLLFPGGLDFELVLEPAGYQSERLASREDVTCLAGA